MREELGLEQLDAGASRAFAVADHQVAHVYVKRPRARRPSARDAAKSSTASSRCSTARASARSGSITRAPASWSPSPPDRWFSYYFWLDDARAPDYAAHRRYPPEARLRPGRAVHRPEAHASQARDRLAPAQEELGFRNLMDVIPLDATLVKGSHGRLTDDERAGPRVHQQRAGVGGGEWGGQGELMWRS